MVVNQTNILKIYLSALAAQVIDYQINSDLLAALSNHNNTQEIARSFGDSRLVRQLYLKRNRTTQLPKPDINHNNVIIFGDQEIGQIHILYKNTIPGEIQAKLTVENATDRFLEYLQKIYKIVVLDESDFHVKVFIPKGTLTNFNKHWEEFIKNVAFSIYGDPKYNLPGLIHTFVSLLNTVKLSKRETGGFGILRVPIITEAQADIMAAWYYSIIIDKLSHGKLTDENKEEINQISDKLGNIQYALAKVASIFPTEVLTDFEFCLVHQGSKEINLANRHLVFIKGLMECYGQSIIVSGKEINSNLGAAVRYVEQDSPLLADYFLVKSANITNKLQLERIRELYFKILQRDMNSSKQLSKRAQLYRDVAALTGLTYAFVQSLENTAKKSMKIEDAEREMSKIIEQVGDAVAFCYYATLGDQDKKSVQARLYRNNDNYFIYDQAKDFLETKLQISDRQKKDEATQKFLLTFYADDVIKAYTYFAENGYGQDREWNEFTYNLKLSLYTRFPELVRKLKTTSEN